MKTKIRIMSILLATVMVLALVPFSALNIFAEGGYTVTLYANDGQGTQKQIEDVSGLYVLPQCDFTPPPEMTFKAWAIGSESGEQKQPGAAINITADTLIVAIWTESAAMYETRPNGGVTGVNGTFDIRYRLNIQPDIMYLEFYNDYQGKWAEKFTLATMPEYEGALTHFNVPTIHKDTEETVLFRLVAYKDGIAYYSNEFAIKYTNNRFTKQPEDAMLDPGAEYKAEYAMSFTPSEVTVEYKDGGVWKHYSNAMSDGVTLSGGDGEMALTFRVRAIKDGDAYYSREFTVRWCEVVEVSTWGELLNAVNSDKTYIKLMANIKDIVPDDELPTVHRLKFDGGKNYVLDLNGCDLAVLNHINEYYSGDVPMINVSNGSALEIKDGSLLFDNWGAGGSNRKAKGVVHAQDTSTLVATNVTMKNTYAGTVVSATDDSTVTIYGGEYVVQSGFAISLDRQASLTLDGGVYIHTVVGDSSSTQYIDGYGALYSSSTGRLEINNAFFKSGIQVNKAQIGAFSIAAHEVTINGKMLSEDIFVGTSTEAKNQNKEYFWYSYNQYALERVQDNSFSNTVNVISLEKKYPIDVINGTAMVNGTPVTEAGYGQTVTIVANDPEAGMEFMRWDTSGVELADYYSASTTFTMCPSPVTLAAYYGKEAVKTVSVAVGDIIPGQKAHDTKMTAENGVNLGSFEWREEGYLMDEDDIFKAGKTYTLKLLVYPPEDCKFGDSMTATVNGGSATASANPQYAYIDYTFAATESVGFSVVYDTGSSQLGVGGKLVLNTALMAEQSASFKSALDAGKVTYQWYRNGEAIDGATESVYNLTAEDAQGRFYVVVTADGKTNYGHYLNCGSDLYRVYLNATEIIAGGRAPQLTPATPGIAIDPENTFICEMENGNPVTEAHSLDKVVLIPGRSYRITAKLIETGADIAYMADVYINGELMPETVDGLVQVFYDFDVPEADFDVYYTANGEIGIGVTLTVDVEKMCEESPTFKHALEAANPTYQTVFYQWCRNGEAIKDATKATYTVSSADKNSLINCKVTLVDGKFGVGEQYSISNIITVLNVNIPYPKDGESRMMSGISADGATLYKTIWVHEATGNTMQGDDKYIEGEAYEYVIVFEVKDGFNFDYQGATTQDMTVAYIYGEKLANSGTGSGLMYYYGTVTAIHKHQYSDEVWDHDDYGHWQPCIVPGCPDPNEEWQMYVPHWGTEATCKTPGKCGQCGYEYYAEHDVAVPHYVYIDEMKCGHFCATEGCDYLSSWSYHEGGVADCQHKAVCEICHHEYGSLGEHVAKAEWVSDENGHWKECSLCDGQKLKQADHVDENGDGECDECGYTIPLYNPGDETETDTDTDTNTENVPDESDPDESTPDGGDVDEGEQSGCASGCGSVVGIGAVSVITSILLGVWLAVKKKED